MGRWTVAEWLAQVQQEYPPFPGGKDALAYVDVGRPHYIGTLLEEKDDEFDDEEDEGNVGKPLPPCPGSPPAPPPKFSSGAHSFSVVARSPADAFHPSLLGAMKNSRRTRGKRGKTDSYMHESMKLGRSTEADSDHTFSRGQPEMLVATRAVVMPRSPDTRRPREFFARSSVKRAPSKSKFKSKTSTGRDAYRYNGQALQILVSTQVTATQSAHDAGRPRVFYPRSSSLNVPPAPPDKDITQTPNRTSRALPALPVASAINAPTNIIPRQASTDSDVASSGPRRIRPLPVPRPLS
ncbi:hypothetical protein B0H12DRAFT_340325 [Mycena haematopus]|nr:hypothetical protein B0H12DRAFT_340325 [Mycena haematopus]